MIHMKRLNLVVSGLAGAIGVILFFSCQNSEEKISTAEEEEPKQETSCPSYYPTNSALYDTIIALDELFWKAYNKGDIDVIEDMMSENHEFYHDRGGVVKTKEKNIEAFREFFRERDSIKGATLANHTEVYEIPGFGALQVGYQQFFNSRNPEGTPASRVITLWKDTDSGWKQEYVFSMHPHPADGVDLEIKNAETEKPIPLKEDSKFDFFNDMMKGVPYDTSNVTYNYLMLFHPPGDVTDTILSTGMFHRSSNSNVWIKTSENLIDKYRE